MKKINNGFANEKAKEEEKGFATEKPKKTKSYTCVRDTNGKKK